jgi:O-antigen chain-terminating methyltransferase
MNPDFYRAFEDRHRGSRESIQKRQSAYLAFLRPLAQLLPGAMLADLGCGRGEWLELVRSEGWAAQGVDLDEGMLRACRDLGLDVRQGDALSYLKGLPDASVAVVSAFHVAEHLPFDVLQAVTTEALRVLRPGGLLVLETPNPENLVVGSSGFYMDPTHTRPLPPLLLSFLPEFVGFGRVKTLRLQEGVSHAADAPVALIDVLAGVSPDYAVVAQKGAFEPLGDAARNEAIAALEAAFSHDYGVTLNALADRHDHQWSARLREVELTAELARDAAIAAQSAQTDALERAAAIREQAVDEIFHARGNHMLEVAGLRGEVRSLHGEIDALHQSRSWKVTAPLRWAVFQAQALRQHGVLGRMRHLARKVVRVGSGLPRAAIRTVERNPKLRRHAISMLDKMGLTGYVKGLRSRAAASSVPPMQPVAPPPAQHAAMTAAARRMHAALEHALSSHARRGTRKES